MAAAVVSVLVEDLLRSLSEGSTTRLGPQWGVEAQLREIHYLLSSVQGVLPDAESKYPYSFELQDKVRELKDAVYDAEDLLEDLSMEEPLRLLDGKLRRLFRHVESCWFGWRMRRKLGAIAGHLRGLKDPLIGIIHTIQVQEVLEAREIPFVRRDYEKGKIIRFLKDRGSAAVGVFVGWGCGTTAVVQEVMKDSGVCGYFDVKIWVNVSPPFDTNRVAQEIIGSLREEEDVEDGEVFGWEQSLNLLARLLDDSKRYLFVIDYISAREWNSARYPEGWLSLRSLLEGGGVASGSKILLLMVSDSWELTIPSFYIGRLDPEDALVLLRETAFQGREDGDHNLFNNPQLFDIMGEIADLCNQWNPRFTKALGGYLSLQPPAVEVWSRLLNRLRDSPDSALCLLLRGGYPYRDLTSPGVKRYDNLLPRIKRCFALCYLFPRGQPINTRTLAELWISLGFIHCNDHDEDDRLQPLEDIAHHYLDVLLREELFIVQKSDIFGKVKSVVLHPAAQELTPSIAGWECMAHDFHITQMEYHARQYARHRSIVDYRENIWEADFLEGKMRTFLHFEQDRTKLEEIYRGLITKLNRKGNSMRVLDLHDVKADVLPECVWKLKHIRYLDLSGNTTLQMLPAAIIGLLNLQTLKLSGCSSLTELSPEMNNLSALRHLYIDGCWKLSLIPRGLCDLKCLNILTDFILPLDDSSKQTDSASLTHLCKLNDLRGSLKIIYLGCYDEELIDEGSEGLLDKKSYLEYVELQFMNMSTDTLFLEKLQPHPNLKGLRIYGYGGSQFPEWMVRLSTHLPNLVEIALIGCENCMDLPLIGLLPHLKKLTIHGLPDLEHMESGSGTFSNLSSLCIKDCPKLNSLPMILRLMKLTLVNVSESIFRYRRRLRNLKTLHLENIEFLEHLPEEWLRDLTNLQELHIGSCPSLGSLSWGLSHLEKLKTLTIWNCKALNLSTDEKGNIITELQGLKSLRCLTIYKALKMEHLPKWLSHVVTLRFLCIRSCPSLEVLPEWIGRLRSFELIHCPRVASLPAGIHDFTSSYPKKLTVVGCPVLESQLREKETEEDRHVADGRRYDSFQWEEEKGRKKIHGASHRL